MEIENKYKRWMITILSDQEPGTHELPDVDLVILAFTELSEKWVFQKEEHEHAESDTPRYHYQCAVETKIRTRKSTLLKVLSSTLEHPVSRIRVERALGEWDQCVEYCSKSDTRHGETYKSNKLKEEYVGNDIDFLRDENKRYPWQNSIISRLFSKFPTSLSDPSHRTIYWITDYEGASGKSVFVKFCCYYNSEIVKLPFGTANQLRSSVISIGPRKLFVIDMPRTLGEDDSMAALLSTIEDIKNGFVVSGMYGQARQLIMDPPHILVFSNKTCPTASLSADRWIVFKMIDRKLQHEYGVEFKNDLDNNSS